MPRLMGTIQVGHPSPEARDRPLEEHPAAGDQADGGQGQAQPAEEPVQGAGVRDPGRSSSSG